MSNIINADNGVVSGTPGLKYTADSSGILQIQTGANVAALTIDASQNATFAGTVSTTGNQTVTGNLTVAGSVSAPNTFGFKNRLINGAMTIAQRATSATITAGSTIAAGYATVDRWYAYCTGANVTMAQVAGTGSVKNNLQITGAASVTAVGVGQRIESQNSYDLAGSTATLSVNMSNSLLTSVTWTAYYANTADTFGTLASLTRTQIATGTFTVTSTLTNYNAQISVPSAATTGIEIVFTVGAQISGTWVIGNVQLEKGALATSFDYRAYSTELAMCQRYYYQTIPSGVNATPTIYAASTNFTVGAIFPHPVTMRISPTITVLGTWAVGGTAATVPTIDAPTVNGYLAYVNGNNGTIGSTSFRPNNSGYLTVSAEM
jgi:hypothetical protein